MNNIRYKVRRSVRRSVAGILIRTLLILLLAGAAPLYASGVQETPPVQNLDRELTLALLPDVDSLPFVVADLKGFFQEEGAHIRLLSFKSPVDRDAAFQAEKVDGVISDLLAAAFALNGGFDVTVASRTNGSYKLLASGSSGITGVPGFRGKGIGMSLNTIIEYSTDRMLTAAGLSGEDIEKVVIPQIPVRLEMLSSGKIDGATLPEPLATMAVLNGAKLIDSTDRMGINPGVLLFRSQVVRENPEAVRALFRGYNRAVAWLAEASREEYIDDVIKAMDFPPAVRDVMVLPDYTPAGLPPEGEVTAVTGWLKERGLIDRTFSYGEMVTPGLLP